MPQQQQLVYSHSVSVLRGVIFGRDDETATLPGSPVHGLDDVNHLLLVLKRPVDFVVVSRAQVDHNVFVPEVGYQSNHALSTYSK